MLYCESGFDINTMELAGIYIRHYRCFHNQFFSLHPLIKGFVRKDHHQSIKLIKTDDFDLFRERKINVKVLCGKNGSGKSTLIQLIRHDDIPADCCAFVFMDADERIAASNTINIDFKGKIRLLQNKKEFSIATDLNAAKPFDDNEEEISFWNTFVYRYLETPELFSLKNDGELLTHYEIQLKKDFVRTYVAPFFAKKMGIDYHIISLDYYVKYPLYLLIAFELQDVIYEDLADSINFNSENGFVKYVDKIFPQVAKYNEELQNVLFNKNYSTKAIITEIPYKAYKLTSKEELVKNYNIIERILDKTKASIDFQKLDIDFFSFTPLKIIGQDKRYLHNLSDGERYRLYNRQKIHTSLWQVRDSKGYLVYFDEPEKHYHPELSRFFWMNLIKEIEFTRKFEYKQIEALDGLTDSQKKEMKKIIRERYFTVIVATHNPFLLSDLFRQNILALEKNKNGQIQEIEIKNTFAGNIAEILCDSMFMEGMIGAFAEEEIKKLLRKSPDARNNERKRMLIERISDPLLKAALTSEVSL